LKVVLQVLDRKGEERLMLPPNLAALYGEMEKDCVEALSVLRLGQHDREDV
jgi:hypothetical protein